jgi:RNA polymerase sigma factor (sigma-70 family)
LNHLTDEELMIEVSKENLDMLTILFDRYHLRIFNFFNKMIRNRSVSEDLTQDVFYKIMKYRSSYKSGNFAAWIYTIARNIFASYYQKQKKENTNELDEKFLKSDEKFSTDTNEDELNHLQRALLKLNHTDRELIIMNRYQEIKYHEMAEIIGSSEGAVKVRVHRALKKLKEFYFQNI